MHRLALGEMGMRLSDFNDLTPYEFNQAVYGYRQKQNRDLDNQLWQTRYIAVMSLNASQKLRKFINPEDLFKLPGEKRKLKENHVVMSKEELMERVQKLNEKVAKNKAKNENPLPKNTDGIPRSEAQQGN